MLACLIIMGRLLFLRADDRGLEAMDKRHNALNRLRTLLASASH